MKFMNHINKELKSYCVVFQVSLAQLSQYLTENFGSVIFGITIYRYLLILVLKILNYDFKETDTADDLLSVMTSNKLCYFLFLYKIFWLFRCFFEMKK